LSPPQRVALLSLFPFSLFLRTNNFPTCLEIKPPPPSGCITGGPSSPPVPSSLPLENFFSPQLGKAGKGQETNFKDSYVAKKSVLSVRVSPKEVRSLSLLTILTSPPQFPSNFFWKVRPKAFPKKSAEMPRVAGRSPLPPFFLRSSCPLIGDLREKAPPPSVTSATTLSSSQPSCAVHFNFFFFLFPPDFLPFFPCAV